uniref:Myosin IXB n=1 Tax=Takifugu rubripes TaxID=31033 RepID=A0A674MSJ4_TAKRU
SDIFEAGAEKRIHLFPARGRWCGTRRVDVTVIRNALVTLGLDDSRTYSLLEVRDSHQEERPLEPSDCLLERVRLWPPETQRWHPETQGYYFVLQQTDSGAPEDGDRIDDYDDLCSLQAVSEASILEALCQRFYRLKIYTYAGNILIAINPNKFLPVYYNPKYIKMYEKQPLGKLSPHIFAVADAAFRAMLDNQVNQCIVMHGNSGSGKTESSSYLIHCLTALSEKTCSVGLKRTILGAVPVLQAFGNARTSENNNSSRFGKFIQLNYLESGVIRGAVIEKWLLEKSRLVSRDKNERNYHVFYYLLMGASRDEQEEFHLLKPQDYFYLNQVPLNEYKRLKQAMEMVGFLASTKKHIFSVLSAILLLGNVTYTLAEDTKVLEVGPAEVLSTLSDLLKVKVDLLTKALTKRKLVVANTTVESQYTLHEASRVRDTMAKSLYSALFEWIILHINHAMLNRRDMEESVSGLSIGILDMFGFENLQKNTFEQLCINYSNEKLQYYINQHIFKFKQEDYVSEGITWQNIDFVDNSGCIQLIGEKPSGLFDLLDQELPWATAKTLLDKLKQLHQDDPFLVTSSNADGTFVIQHFAGRVKYHIQDFRRENNEHMPPEVVSLLRSSEQSFFHHLVASSPEALFRWGVLRATIRIIAVFKSMGRHRAELSRSPWLLNSHFTDLITAYQEFLTLDFSFDRSDDLPLDVFEDIFTNYENRNRSGRQKQLIPKNLMDYVSLQHVVGLTAHDQTSKLIYHPHRTAKVPTYSTQVQASLNKLMARIEKAEPFFIFCIRSNDQKKELHFDSELVLQQIKNMGITQMVHIQKSGYSAKYTFKEFVEKFRLLLPKGATEAPEHIKELFERMEINKSSYQIGKTKVFLKEKERQLLRDTLTKEVMRRIIILQRWFRTCLIRLHFLQRRDATTIIQRSWREYYEKKNRAATVIQSAWASCLKRSPGQPPSQPRLGRDRYTCHSAFAALVLNFSKEAKPKVGYKDLMKGYHNKVNTLAGSKSKTEVSLVINLFQSVLDGFIRGELKRLESEPAKATKTTKKKKKDKCLASPLDHRFSTYQVSIMQSCDLCGSYIWGMEKAYMCSACKLICHKKCLNKIITDCSTRRASTPGSLHFGVQVYMLTSKANPVPKVIEMLLMHVEINGLYTEGLYRKSGSACRAKELHQILETTPESACLDNYVIHTVTGLVKRWLRELPDPLMTFDLYTDFLHAAELPDKAEKIRAVYQKVDELPPANYNTLERLIFHLVRVAKEEEHNKMSPSSLAIVFAPCILRSPDVDNPFLSMKDVPRTTACVEILITEQFRRYKEKMQNIQELEYAEALAVHQLKLRREDLTCRLPELEQENSDNEILDSASSMSSESLEDRLGSVDSEGQ